MSVEGTVELANRIAQKLEEIKELSRKKVVVQNTLEKLKHETKATSEELNRIEATIRSLKYEITDCLTDSPTSLKIVDGN